MSFIVVLALSFENKYIVPKASPYIYSLSVRLSVRACVRMQNLIIKSNAYLHLLVSEGWTDIRTHTVFIVLTFRFCNNEIRII